MSTLPTQVPRIIELAERIAQDIRRRELKPGQAYQSTSETAEMLGVSTTAANRAMQVLAKRGLLDRRQRKGTFVAEPRQASDAAAPPISRVHLLVQGRFLRTEGVLSDGIVVGMHEALPAVQLQFDFLPPDGEERFIDKLIAAALRSGVGEGFVLVRTSIAAQRSIAESGLPTVIHGTLHPSVPAMPWIDRDHVAAGRLLVGHLVRTKKVRQVLVLMRDRLFEGDHVLLDAVRDAMADAGMPMRALSVRALPGDRRAIAASVATWMDHAKGDGPIGVICRSEPLAKGAAEGARRAGTARLTSIILSDYYRKESEPRPVWPHLRLDLSPEQIGQHIGRMLAQQAGGEPVDPPHESIPIRLEL